MEVTIIDKELQLTIFGFGGTATNKDYAGTAFKLSDKMWQTIKAVGFKHKGKNIWVYEGNDKVFAGVEPDGIEQPTALEQKTFHLPGMLTTNTLGHTTKLNKPAII